MGWARDPPNGMNAIAGGTRGLQSKLAFKIAAGEKASVKKARGRADKKMPRTIRQELLPELGRSVSPRELKKGARAKIARAPYKYGTGRG